MVWCAASHNQRVEENREMYQSTRQRGGSTHCPSTKLKASLDSLNGGFNKLFHTSEIKWTKLFTSLEFSNQKLSPNT